MRVEHATKLSEDRSGFITSNVANVVVVFFIIGLGAGFGFDRLSNMPELRSFFFRTCKLCGPTLNYWIIYDLIFLLGLLFSFLIARLLRWMPTFSSLSSFRRTIAACVIGVSNLLLYELGMAPSVSAFGILLAPFLLLL